MPYDAEKSNTAAKTKTSPRNTSSSDGSASETEVPITRIKETIRMFNQASGVSSFSSSEPSIKQDFSRGKLPIPIPLRRLEQIRQHLMPLPSREESSITNPVEEILNKTTDPNHHGSNASLTQDISERVGKLTTDGILLLRADDRSPEEIHLAGGFFPKDNKTGNAIQANKLKAKFIQQLCQNSYAVADSHVRQPSSAFVSTGTSMDSGGYADHINYLYQIWIPNLKEAEIDEATLGAPVKKLKRTPRLLINKDTVINSDLVALDLRTLIGPGIQECMFVTSIPKQYIKSYKPKKENKWYDF